MGFPSNLLLSYDNVKYFKRENKYRQLLFCSCINFTWTCLLDIRDIFSQVATLQGVALSWCRARGSIWHISLFKQIKIIGYLVTSSWIGCSIN